jgi:hypothetical protein
MAKESGFNGVQELTRQVLREKVEDFELKASIERLRANMGTGEVKRLTKKQKEELYQKVIEKTPGERLELLKEFGLEDVRKL